MADPRAAPLLVGRGEKQCARSFLRITGHWPWELVSKKHHPPCWSRNVIMLLLALANQRRRAGYDDHRDFAGFQEFVMGYIMKRVNGPYQGCTQDSKLRPRDIKQMKEDVGHKRVPHAPRRGQDKGNLFSFNTSFDIGTEDNDQEFLHDDASQLSSSFSPAPTPPPPPIEPNQASTLLSTSEKQTATGQQIIRDVSRRYQELTKDLQAAEADLKAEKARLIETEPLDEQVRQAEFELAEATIKAQKADEALHWMQRFFNQKDDQRVVLDRLATEAQRAAREREDALANVQTLQLQRDASGTDNNNAGHRVQILEAKIREIRKLQNDLARQIKSVRLFNTIMRLGPSRFHNVIWSKGIYTMVEAAIRPYHKLDGVETYARAANRAVTRDELAMDDESHGVDQDFLDEVASSGWGDGDDGEISEGAAGQDDDDSGSELSDMGESSEDDTYQD